MHDFPLQAKTRLICRSCGPRPSLGTGCCCEVRFPESIHARARSYILYSEISDPTAYRVLSRKLGWTTDDATEEDAMFATARDRVRRSRSEVLKVLLQLLLKVH